MLTTKFEVNAPIEQVWNGWTTPDGIKTFFASDCKVELRLDGAYEMYFLQDAKPGERGGEGMRILGLEPMRRFASPGPRRPRSRITAASAPWSSSNSKRKMPAVRLSALRILGWGEGASWDETYEYFDHAWNEVVLPCFRYAMEVGGQPERATQAAADYVHVEGQLRSTLTCSLSRTG